MAAPQPTPIETWRPALGWEGFYEVSDHGNVRSVDRIVQTKTGPQRHRGRPLKTYPAVRGGYPAVQLWRSGKVKLHYVHTLVLEAFVGPRPFDMEACHGDGNPLNNHISNLRWDTSAGNKQDMLRHGRNQNASKTHCIRGHEFTPENTYVNTGNGRGCRTCRAEYVPPGEHAKEQRSA